MGAMDEVEERLRVMLVALETFQETLVAASRELSQCHDRIAPVWDDEARKQYERDFGRLTETLAHFANTQIPAYTTLLSERHRSLQAYLFGE
jgi:hypothetical protein